MLGPLYFIEDLIYQQLFLLEFFENIRSIESISDCAIVINIC